MASVDNDAGAIYNLAGAVTFIVYVFAALCLTGLIVFDLYGAYQNLPLERKKRFSNQLQVFIALAVVSFSTLSYHMLSYLILSYQTWATSRNLEPLEELYAPGGLRGSAGLDFTARVWQWLTQSTLFYDFAMTICKNDANLWWTQNALLVSMASALFISIEGKKAETVPCGGWLTGWDRFQARVGGCLIYGHIWP